MTKNIPSKILLTALILNLSNTLSMKVSSSPTFKSPYSTVIKYLESVGSDTPNNWIKIILALGGIYGVKKAYNNRETIKEKISKLNSAIAKRIDQAGNWVATKGLPGKWLLDGTKFGWNNKVATVLTYYILNNKVLKGFFHNSSRYPGDALLSTLILCKLASTLEQFENEKDKSKEVTN